MMKRASVAIFVCLIEIVAFAQKTAPADRIDAVLDVIEKKYLHPTDRQELEARALRSFLEDLDPYSTYMNAEEWALYDSSFAGAFGGIGVTMRIDAEAQLPEVGYLLIGSSAAEAGVQRGDRIVEIDGRSLKGLSLDEVVPMLRGTPGSTVDLKVHRGSSSDLLPLKVRRRVVSNPGVRGVRRDDSGKSDFRFDPENGIGYIRILLFGDDTVAIVEQALADLTKHGLKGIVLDLRDCVGGKMDAAVGTADLFLDRGRIVTVVRRDEIENVDAKPPVATTVPMVMLINDQTTSSAEILAGALADHRRATVMGQRTFGKGRVQEKIALAPGLGGLVLSTGTFQRPSGKTFDKHDAKTDGEAGIAPDEGMEVLVAPDELAAWRKDMDRLDGPFVLTAEEQVLSAPDRVLERGVEILRTLMAGRRER